MEAIFLVEEPKKTACTDRFAFSQPAVRSVSFALRAVALCPQRECGRLIGPGAFRPENLLFQTLLGFILQTVRTQVHLRGSLARFPEMACACRYL